MNVPKSVRLGTVRYAVKTSTTAEDADKLDRDNFGRTVHREQRILLSPGQAPDCLADTLLHETLHMCWFQGALTEVFDPTVEEQVVRGLTANLLTLIRQNPQLIAFLTGKED